MARPSNATVTDATSSGVPFQWLLDGYAARGARDGNMEVLQALVAWGDSDDFLRDVVGYTTWSGGAGSPLHRVPPLQCFTRRGLYCDDYRLVDMGAYETRDSFYDEFTYGFEQDWLIYELTFRRPRWRVFGDETLASTYGNKEDARYCSFTRLHVPRERRVSGAVFEYLRADGDPDVGTDWRTIPDEAAFIPDYQLEWHVTWHQVPVAAVPDGAIKKQLLTVNDGAFVLRPHGQAIVFTAGELLFKGPLGEVEPYQGADGDWYEELAYQFSFQPGGWNSWLRPDLIDVGGVPTRDYGPIRRKNGLKSPPYGASNFANLFKPGA